MREQLKWVQKNRSRGKSVRDCTSLMTGLAEDLSRVDVGRLTAIAKGLSGLVDSRFCRHCRVASLKNGELLIKVDEESLVYPTRVRWYHVLMKELPLACREATIDRIEFRYGLEGQPISMSGDLPRAASHSSGSCETRSATHEAGE